MKTRLLAVAVSISLMTSATSAGAAIIIDNVTSGAGINDFSTIAPNLYTGTISQPGATYGESFAGQTVLTSITGFDTLSGTPSAPLSLQTNPSASLNIGVANVGSLNVIFGTGGGGDGQGALSILFDELTDVVNFNMVGADSGNFTVDFYSANGVLLDSITQSTADQLFGFRVTSGALIHGISITNTDGAGVGYGNVRFNPQGAPDTIAVAEPAMIAMLGLGVLTLGVVRRRRASF